jgi:two-component system, NarL family, sensor histidine kinase DesK
MRRPGLSPWSRYGWIIQSVWLVFLIFPIIGLVDRHLAGWQVALGVVVILAFGLSFSLALRHLDRLEKAGLPRHGAGARWLLALVLCALITVPLIGFAATSFLPFIVAFAMFGLPLAIAIAVAVVAFAASALATLSVDVGQDGWVVAFIGLSVGVMAAGIRVLASRGARYEAMSRELDLVAERERVARDVHDVLGHSLTVVTVKAELAERLVEADPERARAELAAIQQLSRQALAEIRATVGGLRAARLDDELEAARSALGGAGIRAELPAGPEDVDPRHRTVLAWVLREAVTNVVRHSEASSCRVELASNVLRVVDDGRGLGNQPVGNGLRGVRERVEGAGGTLRVATPAGGRGTELEVTL